jgi:hypothetical protein
MILALIIMILALIIMILALIIKTLENFVIFLRSIGMSVPNSDNQIKRSQIIKLLKHYGIMIFSFGFNLECDEILVCIVDI